MMEADKLVALVLVILLVVGLNGWFIVYVRRGGSIHEIELFRRAAKAARNPWQREDTDLQELGRLVDQFREQPSGSDQSADPSRE